MSRCMRFLKVPQERENQEYIYNTFLLICHSFLNTKVIQLLPKFNPVSGKVRIFNPGDQNVFLA